jgi:hypothetical protein
MSLAGTDEENPSPQRHRDAEEGLGEKLSLSRLVELTSAGIPREIIFDGFLCVSVTLW